MILVHPDAPKSPIDVDDDRVALFKASGWVEHAEAEEIADDRPAGNASLQVWVDYALANGVAEDDMRGFNRDQVRDLFQ